MNIEELRSVQTKERRTDSLQDLRPSFYREVGEYVAERKAERDRLAEQADDPFSSPEVARLTDEIETATDVVEAIYERRMGKLVKQASLAAAGMDADDGGLTAEEADLFEDLVDRIRSNKGRVLDALDGGADGDPVDEAGRSTSIGEPAPDERPSRPTDETVTLDETAGSPDERSDPGDDGAADTVAAGTRDDDATGGVSAADAMGPTSADGPTPEAPPSGSQSTRSTGEGGPDGNPGREGTATKPDPDSAAGSTSPSTGADRTDGIAGTDDDSVREDGGGASIEEGGAAPVEDGANGDVERKTVRITRDVGAILGVDDREYTLAADDVVTLPEQNADPLVERDAAEPLD